MLSRCLRHVTAGPLYLAGGGLHGCREEGGGMDWQYGLVPEQGRDPNVTAAVQMAVVLEL